MMYRLMIISLCFSLCLLLTGCWDALELPDRAFAMGIAIDQTEDEKIKLTTQFYKPASTGTQNGQGGGQEGETDVTVQTTDDTVIEAVRDIPIHLGRKAHWGHVRAIIIGEELARNKSLGEFLEFFYRDHEPRITSSVMITKGKAADYLKMKPLVDSTTGQQLLSNEEGASDHSRKTIDVTLLKLAMQMRSEVDDSIVPYVYPQTHNSELSPSVAGVALLKHGKMIGVLSPPHIKILQILLNEYKGGMLQVPCLEQPGKMEAIEILSLQSDLEPVIRDDSLKVNVSVKLEAALQELACSKTMKQEEEQKFVEAINTEMKKRLETTVAVLQETKFDAINLGNKIYAKDPALWKKWKEDWEERFAETPFEFEVESRIINSGTTTGKPAFSD